ncbi:methyl-accepting chemotaxis protein [Paenibacillus sp. HB172176]|uniref:methyl-accepting chemotaxis protein n=1 Tax=Paenibacillus sp. HB172176 TaxID=2493690 RepID=UPI001438D38F|nr:methyl-accepting chemotaxis protein [Paenibacillus sp. HB172176]
MKLSLRIKLLLLAAVPLLFYAGSGYFLIGEQQKVFDEMKEKVYETSSAVDSLILNGDRDMYQAFSAYQKLAYGGLSATDAEAAVADMTKNYNEAMDRVHEARTRLEQSGLLGLDKGDSGMTAEAILADFDESFERWYKEALKAIESAGSNAVLPLYEEDFQKGRQGVDEIETSITEYANQTIEEMKNEIDQSKKITNMSVAFITIVLFLFAGFVIRRIMTTIRSVDRKTSLVRDGDLTATPETKYGEDELGQISRSVDEMIKSMNGLVANIADNSGLVNVMSSRLSAAAAESAEASGETSKHIGEVSVSSENQARSAKETSRAIEEMAIGISRIAENTSALAMHSTTTSDQADSGSLVLIELVKQMSEISNVIEKLSEMITTLENRSQQIGEIAENITAFSNQTNILSLNASIEAARAGEHGKGFAVVAGEIRKLAASSLSSAEGIHDLIAFIQQDINSASTFMKQTMQEVETGTEQVNNAAQSLNLINVSIMQMAEQLQENSAITEQMSASSEEVSASMEQTASSAALNLQMTENVATATEKQIALMNHVSATSRELDEIVGKLQKAVSTFKV